MRTVYLLLILLLSAACGGGGGGANPPVPGDGATAARTWQVGPLSISARVRDGTMYSSVTNSGAEVAWYAEKEVLSNIETGEALIQCGYINWIQPGETRDHAWSVYPRYQGAYQVKDVVVELLLTASIREEGGEIGLVFTNPRSSPMMFYGGVGYRTSEGWREVEIPETELLPGVNEEIVVQRPLTWDGERKIYGWFDY